MDLTCIDSNSPILRLACRNAATGSCTQYAAEIH
ncbi:hypothetical protein B0G57_12238 [Trinickia symbiotica]|nr:hypothetical protein B0G57_12238 [Trinickia symbiotica]